MKRAVILFIIVFAVTLLLPMITMIKPQGQDSELVTLFNSFATLLNSLH